MTGGRGSTPKTTTAEAVQPTARAAAPPPPRETAGCPHPLVRWFYPVHRVLRLTQPRSRAAPVVFGCTLVGIVLGFVLLRVEAIAEGE